MLSRTEHAEQTVVITWARLQQSLHPALRWLHSIPNGASLPFHISKSGHRKSNEAIKLKEEGMTSGICDLFLPWAARGWHGFYMEMKRPGNLSGLSENQKEFLKYLEMAGFLGQVFDDADDVIGALKWYLNLNT